MNAFSYPAPLQIFGLAYTCVGLTILVIFMICRELR